MTINIMCFHVPLENPGKVQSAFAWKSREHFSMYQAMVASIRKLGISAKFHFVTYETTRLPAGLVVDEVLRIPATIAPINDVHRLRVHGWQLYCQSNLFDRPTIAVDLDLLFQGNPLAAFDDDYDIGLTYHSPGDECAKTGIINTGVIFLKPDRRDAVINFFRDAVRKIEETKDLEDTRFHREGEHTLLKEWGGDEITIMAMFEPGELASLNQQPKTIRHGATLVRTFPAYLWNCQDMQTPNGGLTWAPGAVIVHFCGYRKRLFFDYAKTFLGLQPI